MICRENYGWEDGLIFWGCLPQAGLGQHSGPSSGACHRNLSFSKERKKLIGKASTCAHVCKKNRTWLACRSDLAQLLTRLNLWITSSAHAYVSNALPISDYTIHFKKIYALIPTKLELSSELKIIFSLWKLLVRALLYYLGLCASLQIAITCTTTTHSRLKCKEIRDNRSQE